MKPSKNLFTQVELLHISGLIEIAWIPAKYAIKGKMLRICEGGKWRDGWKVEITYGSKLEEYLLDHERDFCHQRKASDV